MFAPRTKRESAPSRASAPRRAGKTQAQEAQVPAGLMPAWDLGTIAIASAIERERGGGRPLDEGTRREMETRFATDFSSVRVHVDERAAALAESMDAAAFTTGGDVFFGRGEAGPESMGGSARGNELVAHELAHVVQQRGGSSRAELTMGGAGDRHEQEATAAARQMQRGDFVLPSLSAAPAGLIQRRPKKAEDDKKKEPPKKTDAANPTPVKTWAGEFAATGFLAGSFGGSSYGAEIEITFTPNDQVDAEKIALVQAANSYRSSLAINHPDPLDYVPEPSSVKTEKDQDVFKSRLVDDASDFRNFGTHIDAPPSSRTPVAAMTNPAKGNELGESVPTPDYSTDAKAPHVKKHVQFGWRTAKKGKQPAEVGDIPSLNLEKGESGSQRFETAALAIEGVQKNTYYGSVKWGWQKDGASDDVKRIDFELAQQGAPSRGFASATEKWNASTDAAGEKSIPLPVSADKVLSKESDLKDSAGKGAKRIASLGRETNVNVLETSADKSRVRVTVMSGQYVGKTGWIASSVLADPKSDAIPKKKLK